MMQKQKLHLIRGLVILIGGITTLDGRECKGTEAKQTGGTAFLVLTFICYTAYRVGLLAL